MTSRLCIGWLLPLAQLAAVGAAQGDGVGILEPAERQFRSRFEQLLTEVPTQDIAGGWGLARALGPAAVPMLWDLYDDEAHAELRLLVLMALVQAGESTEDPRSLQALAGSEKEDKVALCFAMALGARRQRPVPQFWENMLGRGRSREPLPVSRVAALLACERLPDGPAMAPPIQPSDADDPGIVAAAALAGMPLPESVISRYWRFDDLPRHAGLVWRGYLLGYMLRADARQAAEAVQRAQQIFEGRGEPYEAAHGAAALVLGRARKCRFATEPPWQLRQLLAAESATATLMRASLPPVPRSLEEDAPGRLAVEYVMSRTVNEVLGDQSAWSVHPKVRGDVAIALAWRLCGMPSPPRLQEHVRSLPEWVFVEWAAGGAATQVGELADPVLAQAAALARDGRLQRDVARRLLEEALWRRGSHPGLGLWEERRRLVCDLLLTGSLPGGKYQVGVPRHLRYLPKGFGGENPVFDVAVAFYDHLSRPAPPIPAECRLR